MRQAIHQSMWAQDGMQAFSTWPSAEQVASQHAWKKFAPAPLEEDSTDAGSGLSDDGSSCSSLSAPARGGVRRRGRGRHAQACTVRQRAAGYFKGTPLETIPSSPHTSPQRREVKHPEDPGGLHQRVDEHSQQVGHHRDANQILAALQPGLLAPSLPDTGAVAYGSRLQQFEGEQAATGLSSLGQAQYELMPVKISLPGCDAPSSQYLNRSLPVKKKPVLPDPDGQRHLREHLGMVPAKKRVSSFLLAEPACVIPVRVQPR